MSGEGVTATGEAELTEPADGAMPFSGSRRLEIAEHFRIPYAVDHADPSRWADYLSMPGGAALLWPAAASREQPRRAATVEAGSGHEIPIFGRVLSDARAEQLLAEHGGHWSRTGAVRAPSGEQVGSIWSERDGSILLPFDPDEICASYMSESYLELLPRRGHSRARRGMMHSYYRVRGLLPRRAQIWLRRNYSLIQRRTPFPSWPTETALHDFHALFLALLRDVRGDAVPHLAAWPEGRSWALVLTHDVETEAGLRAIEPVVELERSLGLRSSWNFIPDPHRYAVDDGLVRSLTADGFEVGVHGLRHDGRDFRSRAELERRLPAMREAATRWQAVGFRAPALHRNWDWMPLLGFEYDSSYPDTDPFEPQHGGCCSWLPLFNQGMVELPLTMPQDHTLFVILRHHDESAWLEKAHFLRQRGGMVLLLTHPDYLATRGIMDSYRRVLERFAEDESAWKALPREVNSWWRRRAATTIEAGNGGWRLTGPGAGEATISLTEGAPAC